MLRVYIISVIPQLMRNPVFLDSCFRRNDEVRGI